MNTVNLPGSQLQELSKCITNGRTGQDACAALFLYDYCLTVWDEVKYVWRPRRLSISSCAFMIARYGVMTATILTTLPNADSPAVDNAANALRLISIIASEFIVAVRTWAIWNRSRKILITLAVVSVAAVIPAAFIVAESIISTRVVPLAGPEFIAICSLSISNINQGFVVPYVLTILYEFVTLTLSLIQIIKWRRSIPSQVRAPIIDTLWRDGVLYFSFMLVLGFMNIGIVLQQGIPQIRTGGAELQAVLHSILSTRIVLHLAGSTDSRDITAPGCSVYQSSGAIFTSEFATVDRFTRGGIREDG
ncbi:hypothetical protein BDP27DRAFT_1317141 [Rhodocollybia butyracea]|uniref:DUF6533 domain-containing protein n=1 Tax=Rhodocollybia butyracea TaxID=206335 RepID=A0A9P5Q4I3_9AGAR|nr:hypothetical protein BDP27DRAFT_1317141 [Rhodocollybia butyracea]